MNETEARELLAPARDRAVPPARFSMADVFAEDARLRRRRRVSAIAGSVVAVLIAVIGTAAAVGSGGRHGQPAVTPTAEGPSLTALLDQLSVPPGAVAVVRAPVADLNQPNPQAGDRGFVSQTRFWTTTESPAAALAVLTEHPPAGIGGNSTGFGTDQGRAEVSASYDGAETAALDGPNLDLEAEAMPGGGTAVAAEAWAIVKPAKSTDQTVTGDVISVTASTGLAQALIAKTVTGAQAQRLALDLNALWVTVARRNHECGQSPTSMTLTFHTSAGQQSFALACGTVVALPSQPTDPLLGASTALGDDVDAAFPGLIPTPAPSTAPSP
jgi:hypothetical protein